MSIYNRDYMREGGGPQKLNTPSTWNIVSWLLAINSVVFVINLISVTRLADFLGLSIQSLTSFYVWTPITYQFTHNGVIHFLCNMIGLFFLGRMLLSLFGPRQVLRIFLLGGLSGGFLQILYNLLIGPDGLTIGASGSILAMLAAAATLIPHQRFQLLLFFIIPVSMTLRTALLLVLAVDVITLILILTDQGSDVAVFAHFGGVLFGWLYVRYGFASENQSSRRSKKRKGFMGIRILKDEEPGRAPKEKKAKKPFVTNDIDAILDKINEQGFQSLTDEERKALEKSSNKLSRRLDDDD